MLLVCYIGGSKPTRYIRANGTGSICECAQVALRMRSRSASCEGPMAFFRELNVGAVARDGIMERSKRGCFLLLGFRCTALRSVMWNSCSSSARSRSISFAMSCSRSATNCCMYARSSSSCVEVVEKRADD